MQRPKLNKKIRLAILAEAASRCACDPVRFQHDIPVGVKDLEVHHIQPFRITKDNSPSNLIALCPTCHTLADKGDISTWTLEQLKLVLPLRKLPSESRISQIKNIFRKYQRQKEKVFGEGYYTAAAILDNEIMEGRRGKSMDEWKIKETIRFIKDIQPRTDDLEPELVLAKLCLEVDKPGWAFNALRHSSHTTRMSAQYAFIRANTNLRTGNFIIAVKWYRKCEALGYSTDNLYCNLGDAFLYVGDSKKSRKVSEKYFLEALNAFESVKKEDTAPLFNKGRLMIKLGDFGKARECFECAVALGQHYPLPCCYSNLSHFR